MSEETKMEQQADSSEGDPSSSAGADLAAASSSGSVFSDSAPPCIKRLSRRYLAGLRWYLSKDRGDLTQYTGRWIAVLEDGVVASGADRELVRKKATGSLGASEKDILVTYVEDNSWVL